MPNHGVNASPDVVFCSETGPYWKTHLFPTLFLSRVRKIAVTVPGDNSVDVLTNDIGIVVITDAAGELQVRRPLKLI